MQIGNPHAWKKRAKLIELDVLNSIVKVWPHCVSALKRLVQPPHEDTITFHLGIYINKDPKARGKFIIDFKHKTYNQRGISRPKGEIDMAVLMDIENDENYLGYECKCLNVKRKGRIESQAGKYVKEGVCRFVSGKYSENLPAGCMLGYVLDGNVDTAHSEVNAMLAKKGTTVKILPPLKTILPSPPLKTILPSLPLKTQRHQFVMLRFSSSHKQISSGKNIEIRHTLLSYLSY